MVHEQIKDTSERIAIPRPACIPLLGQGVHKVAVNNHLEAAKLSARVVERRRASWLLQR